MKKLNLDTKITVCSYEELSPEEKILIDRAKEASNLSYAPYSRFQVGAAALLNNGEIIQGNNRTQLCPLFAFLGGCSRTAGRWNCGVRHESGKCRISLRIMCRTRNTFFRQCQLSRYSCENAGIGGSDRRELHRRSSCSVRSLPTGNFRNRKSF